MGNNRIIIKSNDPAQTDQINFSRVEELGNVALDAVQKAEPEAVKFLETKGYKDVKYITDIETDSVIIVAGNGKDIVVSIRGKDSEKDNNTVAPFRGKTGSSIGGEVGIGYIEALYKNNKQLLTKITSAIQDLNDKYEEKANVNFASHSMGGALSSVMLAEIKAHPDEYKFSKNIKAIITFASLPPSDGEFAKKYKEMCENNQIECIDITHRNDLSFLIPVQNYAVNRRVIINKNGTVTIDPSLIEKIGRTVDFTISPSEAHDEGNILAAIRKLASEQGISGGKDIPAGANISGSGSGDRTDKLQR